MSSSEGAIAWIAFAATVIQAGASMLQVAQGAGAGGYGDAPRVTVQVKRGFLVLLLELIAWLVSRSFNQDRDTFGIYLIYLPVIIFAGYACGSCLAALNSEEVITVYPDSEEADAFFVTVYHTWADVIAFALAALVCLAVVFTCLDLVGLIDITRVLSG
ncbi:hypothetical protein [Micromonospora ureilytica]|uniref:hypothetical protein n=1 Tax=Micromonospora ureilytica TaxID=709868 RepID=UPI004039261A